LPLLALPLLAFVVLSVGAPGAAHAAVHPGALVEAVGRGDRILALAPPVETCNPQETRGAGGFNICSPEASAGGGVNLGALLPILAAVALGGLVLLIAAAVILRRTSTPLLPADPGEWWTCRSCGKNNVLGSARCYACGAWQR
jgi:hypothetical protein